MSLTLAITSSTYKVITAREKMGRLKFVHACEYANTHLPGEMVMLTNADITIQDGFTSDNLNNETLPINTILIPMREEPKCIWDAEVDSNGKFIHQVPFIGPDGRPGIGFCDCRNVLHLTPHMASTLLCCLNHSQVCPLAASNTQRRSGLL